MCCVWTTTDAIDENIWPRKRVVVGVVVVARVVTNHGRVPMISNKGKANWPDKTREFATGTPATGTNQSNRSVPDNWHTIPKG